MFRQVWEVSMNRIVINVVSGKGGTGKTLVAAVLGDMLGNSGKEVLVIDMDIFVRGLTALLYFYRSEALELLAEGELATSAFFAGRETETRLGICRYRSFHVLPAVSRIDENLGLRDMLPDSRAEARGIMEQILNGVGDRFQIVLLDSRAGYDELVAATHSVSDATICVEEEDAIAKITTDNLVTQLQAEYKTPLFRLINKARGPKSADEGQRRGLGVSDIGSIPFDIDVMNSFGSPLFWDEIGKSLFRGGLARAWNRLCAKMRIGAEVYVSRVSAIGSSRLEARIATLTWRDRVMFVYGIVVAFLGLGLAFGDYEFLLRIFGDPVRLSSFVLGIGGLVASVFVVTRLGLAPKRRKGAGRGSQFGER